MVPVNMVWAVYNFFVFVNCPFFEAVAKLNKLPGYVTATSTTLLVLVEIAARNSHLLPSQVIKNNNNSRIGEEPSAILLPYIQV